MRRAAFLAGLWYPGDEPGCRSAIGRHSERASSVTGSFGGLIGPHAGWTYSGDCAARTYHALASVRSSADLVVVMGSHRGPRGPHTIFRGDGWETPLGTLETDLELATRVADELALDDEPVRPLRPDNGAELHLPFVRHFFPRARLLMLGVGACELARTIGRRVGELARELDRDAVFVGSTDLTHYGPNYAFTPAGLGREAEAWVRSVNDAAFLEAVLQRDAAAALAHAISHGSACCPGAAAASLEAVHAHTGAVSPTLVDYYLSSDVRPDASFVGYAGVLL